MPETPFPPDFTKCADCGCCVAKVYAGNAAICWECDEGKPCKGRGALQLMAILERAEVPA